MLMPIAVNRVVGEEISIRDNVKCGRIAAEV